MSNTNGQTSFVKSMNGILSFNTGGGTIIQGDTVTTDVINCVLLNADDVETINVNATTTTTVDLNVTNSFNVNGMQGILPTDVITLYTNSTGAIGIGSATSTTYMYGGLQALNLISPVGFGTANIYAQDVLGYGNRYTLNIGSSVSTTNLNGNNVINTANASANGTAVNLYTTNTTGVISIGGTDGTNNSLVSIPCNTILGRTTPASTNTFYGTTVVDTISGSAANASCYLYTNLISGGRVHISDSSSKTLIHGECDIGTS